VINMEALLLFYKLASVGLGKCIPLYFILGQALARRPFIFAQATVVCLSGMILGQLLKHIWQVPLQPHVQSLAYAYPSGHTLFAVVFWGWMLRSYPSRLMVIVACVVVLCYSAAMMGLGYHQAADIIGALLFGVAYVLLVHLLDNQSIRRWCSAAILWAAAGILAYALLPRTQPDLYLPIGGLVGTAIGLTFKQPQDTLLPLKMRLWFASIVLVGSVIWYLTIHALPLWPTAHYGVIAFGIGLWASYGTKRLTYTLTTLRILPMLR
jgi:hypothetical protein